MAGISLTKTGLAKLEEEFKRLRSEKQQVSKEIGIAREWGDLKENAEYHAAKEKLQHILEKMNGIQFKLANANVVDPKQNKKGVVTLGTEVTVKDLTQKKEEKYILVGAEEADPIAGKISIDSPLGKAFLGHKPKEKVTVLLPAGSRPYQILGIKPYE